MAISLKVWRQSARMSYSCGIPFANRDHRPFDLRHKYHIRRGNHHFGRDCIFDLGIHGLVSIRVCHDRFAASKTSSARLALPNASPKSERASQQVSRWVPRSSPDWLAMPETLAYTSMRAAVKAICTTWLFTFRKVYWRLYQTRSFAMSTADWRHI
jgi:hypothetical protein